MVLFCDFSLMSEENNLLSIDGILPNFQFFSFLKLSIG